MRIAISGTIGSGKTTVCNYLRSKGLKVFDCDEANRELLKKGNKGYNALISEFNGILDANGEIDKSMLAAKVFSDDKALKRLDAIMHPLILEVMLDTMDEECYIAEVPLLFETEFKNYFDYKLLIAISDELAIKRLSKRGFSKEAAKSRLAKQMNVNEKIRLADEVIYNDSDEASLYLKIDKWLERIKDVR